MFCQDANAKTINDGNPIAGAVLETAGGVQPEPGEEVIVALYRNLRQQMTGIRMNHLFYVCYWHWRPMNLIRLWRRMVHGGQGGIRTPEA